MTSKVPPSFDEFRACVLDSYATVMRDKGYVELEPRKGEFVNEFSMRIGNGVTVIEVEGINWGMHSWTKVFRASESAGDAYGLPIGKLLDKRQGLSAKQVRKRQNLQVKRADQLAEIRETAQAIIEHADDVLSGDFTALDQIAEQERRYWLLHE